MVGTEWANFGDKHSHMSYSVSLQRRKASAPITSVILIVIINGERKKYSTKVQVSPNEWDVKEACPVNQSPKRRPLRMVLDNTIDFCRKQVDEQGKVTHDDVHRFLFHSFGYGNTPKGVSKQMQFFDYAQMLVDENPTGVKAGTLKSYKSHLNVLKAFAESSNLEMSFETINLHTGIKLKNFMRKMDKDGKAKYSVRYYESVVKFLHLVMNGSLHDGLHQSLTFKAIKRPNKNTKPFTLSLDDIKTLANYKFKSIPQEQARDLFLFGLLIGQRFSDYSKIKQNQFRDGHLHLVQEKTGKALKLPLHPDAKRIAEKYHYSLPQYKHSQKFNQILKRLSKVAGLVEDVEHEVLNFDKVEHEYRPKFELISSHTARYSFSTLFHELGYSDREIMAFTAHSDAKMLQTYIGTQNEHYANSFMEKASKFSFFDSMKAV